MFNKYSYYKENNYLSDILETFEIEMIDLIDSVDNIEENEKNRVKNTFLDRYSSILKQQKIYEKELSEYINDLWNVSEFSIAHTKGEIFIENRSCFEIKNFTIHSSYYLNPSVLSTMHFKKNHIKNDLKHFSLHKKIVGKKNDSLIIHACFDKNKNLTFNINGKNQPLSSCINMVNTEINDEKYSKIWLLEDHYKAYIFDKAVDFIMNKNATLKKQLSNKFEKLGEIEALFINKETNYIDKNFLNTLLKLKENQKDLLTFNIDTFKKEDFLEVNEIFLIQFDQDLLKNTNLSNQSKPELKHV